MCYNKLFFVSLLFLLFVSRIFASDTLNNAILYADKARLLTDTNIELAHKLAENSLKLAKMQKDTPALAICYYSYGVVLHENGNFNKALKLYEKSVDYAIVADDFETLNLVYNNMGVIYRLTGLTDMAEEYLMKSYEYAQLINDTTGMIYGLSNLANTYALNQDYYKADSFYKQALSIAEAKKEAYQIAYIQNNLGYVNFLNSDFTIAETYYLNALKLFVNEEYKYGEHSVLNRLSELYLETEYFKLSLFYIEQAEGLIDVNTSFNIAEETYNLAYNIHKSLSNTDQALKYFELSSALRDSMENKELKEYVAELESVYENEKLKNENALKSERLERQRNTLRLLSVLASFILLSAILLFLQIVQKTRFNKRLNEQNKIISKQNQTINDSIDYAAHILSKGMLNDKIPKSLVNDSFVMYKPRDRVGGDFYRIFCSGNICLIAVADCTGHGVAGGFLSTLSNQFLEKSIEKFGIDYPGKIMQDINRQFFNYFNNSANSVNESMDISLLLLKNNEPAIFSANKQRLWVLKDKIIKEYRGDNAYLGYIFEGSFNEQIIEFEKGSKLFLFTDGYADQFGGKNNGKLKYQAFKNIIIETYDMDSDLTHNKLQSEHNKWRSNRNQTDDILVLGLFC
jgi:serine phosphatase RsbU (regulator of sigma subunit)